MNAISEVTKVEAAPLGEAAPPRTAHAADVGSPRRPLDASSSCCPLLVVFGAFSWYPIVRTAVMAFQHTNLVQAPTWVGLQNFSAVIHDPQTPIAVKNTAYFALLALVFGYPIPLAAAVLMSEVRNAPRAVQRARLPAGRDPAGRRGAALEDLLRREPDGRLQHDPRLGRPRTVPLAPVAVVGDAVTRARVDVGERRRDGDHLSGRTDRASTRELYEAAAVDGAGLWRKVWHVTLPQLRGVLLVTLILQIIGTAQVFLEPYLFTSGGPANATLTVLLQIYNYAFGNSLGGDYGKATALSLMLAGFLALFSLVYLRATRSWSEE